MMRRAVFKLIIAVLVCYVPWSVATCFASARRQPDFQSLYEGHHWFALRDAVEHGKAPLFYRGAVKAAFNQSKQAQEDLEAVIRATPHTREAYEAHELLAGLFLRAGLYREALAQTEAMLAENPAAEDARNVRPLLQVLSETPDQAVERKKASTFRMRIDGGNIFVPITINNGSAEYAVDTGAAVSLLSESEATRLGLAVRKIDTRMEDMSGAGTGASVAVAQSVTIGDTRLTHVAFYVLADNQPPFADLPPSKRGIIDIPVILALESLRWNPRAGTFSCGFTSRPGVSRQSNLAFEGAMPLTQVLFQHKPLEFSLDTGAQSTDLYPSFAKAFAKIIRASGRRETHKLTGIDGSANFDSVVLPSVTLQVGADGVLLKPAHVLLVEHSSTSSMYFGNLSMDLLNQARNITLDFRSMRLTLD